MTSERYDKEQKLTDLWKLFQNGRAYQSSKKLTTKLPMFVRFYEGDQWPAPTKNTRNLPRPVVNITKMICRSKKSAILSTPVRIVYKSDLLDENVERFNFFSDYIQKELGQDALDKKGIDDGVKKGSYFYHYYWDAEARGMRGNLDGALRGEMIDPLDIFFEDPTEADEQKQAWIMIASRETVESVRAKCDADVDTDLIRSDEAENPYAQAEQEGSELVTVLTRYFRRNGEVYIEKATRATVINKPFPLTPDIEAARAALTGEDAGNNALPDKAHQNEALRTERTRAYLYPIVVGNYEYREKCIYGLGEIEGIVPNQRAINFNIAMMLLSAQENGLGKYIVSKDALHGQVITNEPGQVLVDYSPGGNGIKRMQEPAMPSGPMQIVDSLTQLTRVVTGASEVMTGETIGAGMSGAAIAQLQSQALQPVEELKNTFWSVKEKQGRVLAQFYKLYYTHKGFSYTKKNEKTGEEEQQRDTFNSTEFADVDFEVVVEAVGGTHASVAGDINALDVALQNKAISLKTYFELYPSDALSNRTEIMRVLESEEANKEAALQAQIEMLTQQLAEREERVKTQEKTVAQVTAVIEENQRLRGVLANLYSEAAQKIKYANEQMRVAGSKIAETTSDAQAMAQYIAELNTVQ